MRFRFSGHESFPCRYTWLPKAYNGITDNPNIFSDDNEAMVKLGVGKNMVKSIRFWVQAFGVAVPNTEGPGLQITDFGHFIFGPDGLDPFLEDVQTLWLLHWKISSIKEDPLFSWHFLFNQWSYPEFSRSEILKGFTKESERMERPLSDFTKEQHFDIFLRTYVSSRAKKNDEVLEDSLDCPLNELQLIVQSGSTINNDTGKLESLYEFNPESTRSLSSTVFIYCLYDYWQTYRPSESTLTFKEVSSSLASVGQIFKMNELEIRTRLESIHSDSEGQFEYVASVSTPRILKHGEFSTANEKQLIDNIYNVEV